MDQCFADFDFESFPDEIRPKPAKNDHSAQPPRPRKKPVTALSATFHVCGPQDKTQKRLRELVESLDVKAIVQLVLVPETDEEFEKVITSLRELAAGIVSGSESIEIGDNHKQHKCSLKLSCSRCWAGEHGASHTTSNWIICNLLGGMYRVIQRKIDVEDRAAAAADVWNVEEHDEDEEHGSYRYIPHEKQDYLIRARARTNASMAKLQNLFRVVIPGFFAGTMGMPRIGALRTPQFKRQNAQFAQEDKLWCKKPYCTRTLLAPAITDRQGAPVCNKFHSDESSFLTSLLRILVECNKVARPVTAEADSSSRPPREPRPPRAPRKPAVDKPTSAVVASNTFSTLADESKESEDPEAAKADPMSVKADPEAQARLDELEAKLAAFLAKNVDAIKVNKSMRDRRDKMQQQIAKQRELIAGKRDSFDD